MDRAIQILLVVVLLAAASTVRAQTAPGCGVDVEGPAEVEVSTTLRFKARVSGVSEITKPEFKWMASSGTITAGQVTFPNETAEHLARARSYMLDVREIDRNRIVTLDCGFSNDLDIHLYIGNPGATPPACANDGMPFSAVKFTKPRPKSHGKH